MSSPPISIYLLLALPPHPSLSLFPSLALPLLSLPLRPLYITVLICFVFFFFFYLFDLFTVLVRFIPFLIQPGQPPSTIHPSIRHNLQLPLHNTRRSVLVGHIYIYPLATTVPPPNTNLPGLLDYLTYWCWTFDYYIKKTKKSLWAVQHPERCHNYRRLTHCNGHYQKKTSRSTTGSTSPLGFPHRTCIALPVDRRLHSLHGSLRRLLIVPCSI